MKNKVLIFMLATSGLIATGQTANAATTFSCPEIDVTSFHKGSILRDHNSYEYSPYYKTLQVSAEFSQNIFSNLTIKWHANYTFRNVTGDNPDSKEIIYNLEEATLTGASLGYLGAPICKYEMNFSGLLQDNTSLFEFQVQASNNGLYCTRSGTTFTCP